MSTFLKLLLVAIFALVMQACGDSYSPNTSTETPDFGLAQSAISMQERRVAIVYSDATAKNYFDEFSYGQLFTAAQHQAMQAGMPYDLLNESDLVDVSTLEKYDALIIPRMSNIDASIYTRVVNALKTAQSRGVGIITSSEFMVSDQSNKSFPNAFSPMIDILGLTPNGYHNGVAVNLNVTNNTHPATNKYLPNELLDVYEQTWFAEFAPVTPAQATTLVEAKLSAKQPDGSSALGTNPSTRLAAVQVLEREGRVVHFASDAFMADRNLLWGAIRWVVYGDSAPVSLLPSRSSSVFLARNDMDQAMIASQLIETEIPLLNIIKDWKNDYNFVGSYYIDIGDNPAAGEHTNWNVSAPLYTQYMDLGNEIGTHSWTHPHYTSELSDTELEYEFNQSRQEISTQLGIDVKGGAVPGNPENLNVVENLNQWFEYFSGRSITGSNGYRSGYGFLKPEHTMRYFSLNMTPDFGLIDFLNHTPKKSEKIWRDEFDDLETNAELPVMQWLWHDYGPTTEAAKGRYSKAMFEKTLEHAFDAGSEFVTLADYHDRLSSLESATLTTGLSGNITAVVEGSGLGQFALKVDSGKQISSVSNWYAYNSEKVFIPDNGGKFTIATQSTPAQVTRIVDLPMRARLLSVNGNANELDFSFVGQGEVTVLLSPVMQNNVNVTGADSFIVDDEKVVLMFNNDDSYDVSLKAINPVNSPPVARAGSAITTYAMPVELLLDGTDPNNDSLSYELTNQPSFGVLSGVAPNIVYTPNEQFSGIDTLSFIVSDGALDSAAVNYTITVGSPISANSKPVANKAIYNTVNDQSLPLMLSGADNEGQNLQYTIVSPPQRGSLTGNPPAVSYQPASGFIGVDEFSFKVNDGSNDSAVARVVIHVSEQPVPSNGTVSNVVSGTVTVDGQIGEWSNYKPFGIDPNEALELQGYDWKQAWMSHDATNLYVAYEHYQETTIEWRNQIYIDADTNRSTGFTGFGNEYPIGVDFILEGNALLEYTGTGTDWSWIAVRTITAATSNNVVELAIPRNSLKVNGISKNYQLFFVSVSLANKIDFYPDDANNSDAIAYTRQFSYSIDDNPILQNTAPIANPAAVNTANNAEVSILLTGFDYGGDTLDFSVDSQPVHGTLSGTAPNLTYMPNAGFVGQDSFGFSVDDGVLGSNTASISVNVVAPPVINGVPVALNQSVLVQNNESVNVTLVGRDYEDVVLTYHISERPKHGTLQGTDQNLTYVPNSSFSGIDSFTFYVSDGNANSLLATVSLMVSDGGTVSNILPVADNQLVVTDFETAIGITLEAQDADLDPLTYTIKKNPTAGVVTGSPPNLTYTPFVNASGRDSLTFVVNDGTDDSVPATVSITVHPPVHLNRAPTAISQTRSMNQGASLNLELTATDPEQDSLVLKVVANPVGGTLSGVAPNLVYTPNANFSGVDRLHFIADDGDLQSSEAIVTIDVARNPNAVVRNNVTNMNIDGDINDWLGLVPFANDPDDVYGVNNPLNWRSLMMAHDADNIYMMFRNDNAFTITWGHGIFLDVDGRVNTGFKEFNNESPIGADYLIEGHSVHQYIGTGNDWAWTYVGSVSSVLNNDILELSLPRSMLSNPSDLQLYLRASNEPFGGNIIDFYPDNALNVDAELADRVHRYTLRP